MQAPGGSGGPLLFGRDAIALEVDQIIDQLRQMQQSVSQTVQAIPTAQFIQGTAQAWSPCDYLKHLLSENRNFLVLQC